MISYFWWSVNLFSKENELFLPSSRDNTECILWKSESLKKWAICHLYKCRFHVPRVTFWKKFIILQKTQIASGCSTKHYRLHKIDNNFYLQGVIHIFHRVINIAFRKDYQRVQTNITKYQKNRKPYFHLNKKAKITLHNRVTGLFFYVHARLSPLTVVDYSRKNGTRQLSDPACSNYIVTCPRLAHQVRQRDTGKVVPTQLIIAVPNRQSAAVRSPGARGRAAL